MHKMPIQNHEHARATHRFLKWIMVESTFIVKFPFLTTLNFADALAICLIRMKTE